jgi:TM2 domain-containing membrane protein YozV
MRRINLFRIFVLFGSIAWMSLLEIAPGIAYACWIVIIQFVSSILYVISEKDNDNNDDDYYNIHNFDN